MENTVAAIAEALQKNCFLNVEYALTHSTQETCRQDVVNAWMIDQMAIMQKEINDLKIKLGL